MSTHLADRRLTQFKQSRIAGVLPDYFQEEYPQLITFLDKYYEFMDSDDSHSFDKTINELILSRDIHETSLVNLNYLLKEVGMGVIPTSYFLDPRYAATLLANFYRIKGSLFSAEGFFRAFYQSNVEITYPKRLLFTVGESLIGPDDGFIIQDGALYQIFSVLVRSEIPIAEWGDLYKMFIHPAGFYLGSEVTFTTVAYMFTNGVDTHQPLVVLDSDVDILTLTLSDATAAITSADDMTGIAMDPGGTLYRFSYAKTMDPLDSATMIQIDNMYQNNSKLFSMISHTFDEDSDSAGRSMDFSNRLETFDQTPYPYVDSV